MQFGLRGPGRSVSNACANGLNDNERTMRSSTSAWASFRSKPEKGRIKVQLGTGLLGLNVLALSGLAQPVTKRALMEDRVLAPAFVLLAAAVLAISSPSEASAADPSGIWAKDDGSAKVEIKKCGRGLCGSVVWLRTPKNSRGNPLHDVRNENASLRGRPIIGLPLFSNMRLTAAQHLGGECLQSRRGPHLHGRQADARLATANRAQRLQDVAHVWREDMDQIDPSARRDNSELIEVKAPAEPGTPEKSEPRSMPQPEAPMIEASLEREQLSAPGFTLVTTSARQQPLSGDDVLSMAMTGVAPAPATVAPLTETAAAEEQWPWMQRRSARLASTRNVAQAQAAPAAPSIAKPKPKPVVMAAQEQWPWQQRRSRTAAQAPAPAPATPIFVKPKPKPAAREAQEQWPWMQRRSVVVVATRTAGY